MRASRLHLKTGRVADPRPPAERWCASGRQLPRCPTAPARDRTEHQQRRNAIGPRLWHGHEPQGDVRRLLVEPEAATMPRWNVVDHRRIAVDVELAVRIDPHRRRDHLALVIHESWIELH